MNIYITKENIELLTKIKANEESMSGLINKLLDDYRIENGPDLFPPDIKNIKENKDGTLSVKNPDKPFKIIKTPKQAKKVIKEEKLCPHGFPANGWSCKKGCKK